MIMKNEIQIFNHPEFGQVRTILIGNEYWIVGKDVAIALGYSKPENAIASHVDGEDKTTTLIQGTGSNYKSKTIIINESGLYSLILSSKLPNAKKFKHWVTSEILPSINKTGKYEVKQNNTKKIEDKFYKYMDKYYKGQLVLTLRDLEYFTGICKETFRYYIKSRTDKFISGIDYWLLKGTELRRFKTQNAKANVFAKELILITKKGFDSLNEIIGFDVSPKIFIEDKKEKPKYEEPVDIGIKSDFSFQEIITETIESLDTLKGLIKAFNKYNTMSQYFTYQQSILAYKDKLIEKLLVIGNLSLSGEKIISLENYLPEVQEKILERYKVPREDIAAGKASLIVDHDKYNGKITFMV